MRRLAIAVTLVAASLTACVGPATTVAAYHGKALRAASDAQSQVATARLTASTLLAGKVQRAYAETVFSECEDAVTSIDGSLGSIQPPDSRRSDGIRDQLQKILGAASDALSQLRIAARRDDRSQIRQSILQLDSVNRQLGSFPSDHPS